MKNYRLRRSVQEKVMMSSDTTKRKLIHPREIKEKNTIFHGYSWSPEAAFWESQRNYDVDFMLQEAERERASQNERCKVETSMRPRHLSAARKSMDTAVIVRRTSDWKSAWKKSKTIAKTLQNWTAQKKFLMCSGCNWTRKKSVTIYWKSKEYLLAPALTWRWGSLG